MKPGDRSVPHTPVPAVMAAVRDRTRTVYEQHAEAWDHGRARTLFERVWLDGFLDRAPEGGAILDLGCGAGEPIARYLLERGRALCGVDFAESMLAIARRRFPTARWIHADMRRLDLGERFAGIVAWDSFFHLSRQEQRLVIPRLAAHLVPGGALLLTVGPADGETTGRVAGETVYHASLSPEEYARRMARAGLEVVDFVAEDPECGGHSVLLAVRRGGAEADAQAPGGGSGRSA